VARRIAAAQISHETNVFSSVKTDLAAFERSGLRYGKAIFDRERGTNSAFGGFIEAAGRHGLELIPIVSVWATPSGTVTAEAIRALVAELQRGLALATPLDGVLLGLHGAMVTELDDDGDAFILEAVREVVGPDLPVVATLDLHANISERMVRAATALIGYDTYPHVDLAERAIEATDLIVRVIAGEVKPSAAFVKPPMAPTSQNMPTDRDPMCSLIAHAHEIERRYGVLNVTVAGGFPPADVVETGLTALVSTDGDPELAACYAQELALAAWNCRHGFLGGVTTFDDAAAILASWPDETDRPLVIVDIGDNPWSGSPGDSAEIVRFLLSERVRNAAVAMVVDPESVQRCIRAGVGSSVDLLLGGKTDTLHGDPLPLHGYVRSISEGCYVNSGPMMAGLPVDLGPSVVLVCGEPEIEVLITSKAETPIDLNVFRAHGIEPTKRRVIGLKGKGHFRAAFEPIAGRVVLVEGPGISGSDFRRLPFRKIRRPIWPLDEGVTFE
jgi:microcystin degradation protein MlrC